MMYAYGNVICIRRMKHFGVLETTSKCLALVMKDLRKSSEQTKTILSNFPKKCIISPLFGWRNGIF